MTGTKDKAESSKGVKVRHTASAGKPRHLTTDACRNEVEIYPPPEDPGLSGNPERPMEVCICCHSKTPLRK